MRHQNRMWQPSMPLDARSRLHLGQPCLATRIPRTVLIAALEADGRKHAIFVCAGGSCDGSAGVPLHLAELSTRDSSS